MAVIKRSTKGAPLTHAEMDGNMDEILLRATKSGTVLDDTLTVNTNALVVNSGKRVLVGPGVDDGVNQLQVGGDTCINGNVRIGASTSSTEEVLNVGVTKSYGQSADIGISLGGTDNGYVDSGKTSAYRWWVSGNNTGQNLAIQGFLRGTGWTELARITSAGSLLVGATTARTLPGNVTTGLLMETTDVSLRRAFGCITNYNGLQGPVIALGKTRGAVVGSNTAVTSGDYLGLLSYQGGDGSYLVEGVRIAGLVDGAVSSGIVPSRLAIYTMNTAGTFAERARIASSGNLLLGTTTDDGVNKLQVNGGIAMNPATTTTAPSAGGAGALPATPTGYATVYIGGVARKIAYY